MVELGKFLICLFVLCAISFGSGIEFAAWVYHKERGRKNEMENL